MIRSRFFQALVCLFLGLALSGCLQDECDATQTYTRYEPVYFTSEDLRSPVKATGPQVLENPGKIYYYKDFLLINEFQEGIHFFDNSDPTNPTAISFLPIPGNVDMSIRNDRLYADNYIDLLALDISDPRNPRVTGRIEDVFNKFGFNREFGYIVEYKPTEFTQEVPCDQNWGPIRWVDDWAWVSNEASFDALSNVSGANRGSTPGGSVTGQGGSLARFTIAKDYLYTVSEYDLKTFGLKNPDEPVFLNTVNLGWGIETIFPYKDALFIGANNGMHTVDISNPAEAIYKGSFWHTTACDPVVVDGDFAYVTLRGGTPCGGFSNQLDVLNVSDLSNPYLLNTFEMHHPIGLSIYKDHLYLCEDDQGIKVFDAEVPSRVGDNLITQLKDLTAIDIITLAREEIALVIGVDGLYQFDIKDPANPIYLSHISTGN